MPPFTGNPFLALAQLVQQDPAQAAVLAASSGLVPPAQPGTAGPPSFVAQPGAGPGGPAGGGGGGSIPTAPTLPAAPPGPGGGLTVGPGVLPNPPAGPGQNFGIAPPINPGNPLQQIAGFPVPGAGGPAAPGSPQDLGGNLGLALSGLKAIEGPEARFAPAANPSAAIPQSGFNTPDIQQLIALLLGAQGGGAGGTSAGIPPLGALIGG